MKPSIPEMSEATRAIISAMRDVPVGDTITYRQIEAIIRDDPQQRRGIIQSARRVLLRDDGIAFGAVVGIGYRRLDDAGKLGALGSQMRRGRRAAQRGLHVAASIQPDKLDSAQ